MDGKTKNDSAYRMLKKRGRWYIFCARDGRGGGTADRISVYWIDETKVYKSSQIENERNVGLYYMVMSSDPVIELNHLGGVRAVQKR